MYRYLGIISEQNDQWCVHSVYTNDGLQTLFRPVHYKRKDLYCSTGTESKKIKISHINYLLFEKDRIFSAFCIT